MIKIKDLSFSYPEKEIIKNLSLEVEKGEFVAILGHNGSGKSTLARLLNGILTPSSGDILIDGLNTKNEEEHFAIRKNCAMVFQNPDNQIVATTVKEDIAFGLENLGIPILEMEERIKTTLDSVGLKALGEVPPSSLSGGQKQRVCIAGVIVMEPNIIVFDEATAMLDPKGREDVLSIIKTLKRDGKTIIFITHFMEEASLADRVVILNEGRIALQGKPLEVFSKIEEIKALGLFPPTLISLCHKLKIPLTFKLGEFIKNVKENFSPRAVATLKTSKNYGEVILKTENLSHIYSKGTVFEKTSNKNINIEIKKGEFIGIIGHTGSGKSTLVQHFNALINPTYGSVIAFGENLKGHNNLKLIRQKIGLVFQYPEYQLFEETVFKDVAYGPKNMGLSEKEIEIRVKKALEQVHIDKGLYEKSPFELSGGQKRRVAIAGILAMQPEILVLDEPTAGLDPSSKELVFKIIKSLNEDGITVIIVSHSMEDIARFSGKVIVLENGEIKYSDTPEEVFGHDIELEKIGLSTPMLCKISKELGINTNIFEIDDMVKAIKNEF